MKKHTDALKAKTQEIPAFATKTFITLAVNPDGTKPSVPYIVWHPAAGVNSQPGVTSPRVTRNPQFTGHVVGSTAEQVQTLMDLLEAKLFPGGRGLALTVTGEVSKPLTYACPLPIQVQTDPQPTVVYGVVEVGWSADPV